MPKYHRKPDIVDAFQMRKAVGDINYRTDNWEGWVLQAWQDHIIEVVPEDDQFPPRLKLKVGKKHEVIEWNDWIVLTFEGEYKIVKEAHFKRYYDARS